MADITMCSGRNCPLKDKCYRYTAPKSKYMQSYFTIPPKDEKGNCDMFLGEKSQSIFTQLQDITTPNKDGKSNDKT